MNQQAGGDVQVNGEGDNQHSEERPVIEPGKKSQAASSHRNNEEQRDCGACCPGSSNVKSEVTCWVLSYRRQLVPGEQPTGNLPVAARPTMLPFCVGVVVGGIVIEQLDIRD